MAKQMVNKIVLSSGKTVLFREIKIKDQELASMAAAPKAGDNTTLLGMLMAKELMKLLIVGIDDKPIKASQLENLDELFTYLEYSQLQQALNKLAGGEMGKFQIEVVSFGDKSAG